MRDHGYYSTLALCAIKGIQEMEECSAASGIDPSLLELVKLRASQIMKCEHCTDLYLEGAGARGEAIDQLAILANWRGNDHFSEKEKTALAWAEAMVDFPLKTGLESIGERVRVFFSPNELVAITVAVNMVISWNNLSLTVRASSGK